MFKLTIHDRKGVQLNEGDLVKISNGTRFTFYCRIKYLEKEQVLAPFHTFSFHSFEKIKEVPEGATKSTEERYDIWFVHNDKAEADVKAKDFEKYLMSWRECEHHLEKRSWRITKQ